MIFSEHLQRHAVPDGTRHIETFAYDPLPDRLVDKGEVISPNTYAAKRRDIRMETLQKGVRIYESPPTFENCVDARTMETVMSMKQNMAVDVDNMVADKIFAMMMQRWGSNPKPLLKMECHSCGGKLDVDYNKHIFNCPYCGAVYAIGTNQIYSRGE